MPFCPARIGTTDSEAIFLAILGAGADEAPVAAVKQIVLKLKRMVEEGEDEDRLRFTAALTDGHAIYAFRYAEIEPSIKQLRRERSRRITAFVSGGSIPEIEVGEIDACTTSNCGSCLRRT